MIDCFHRLRHHAIICSNNENRHIRDVCAACTHSRECLMPWRIDKGNMPIAIFYVDCGLISTDTLSDTASFVLYNVCMANSIEQLCFTMIHMPHNGDDWRTPLEVFWIFFIFFSLKIDTERFKNLTILIFGTHNLDVVAKFGAKQLECILIKTLGSCCHLSHTEKHRHQCCWIGLNFLSKIHERRTSAYTHLCTSVSPWNLHTSEHRRLHLFKLLALHTLRFLVAATASLAPKCTSRAATASFTAAASKTSTPVSIRARSATE